MAPVPSCPAAFTLTAAPAISCPIDSRNKGFRPRAAGGFLMQIAPASPGRAKRQSLPSPAPGLLTARPRMPLICRITSSEGLHPFIECLVAALVYYTSYSFRRTLALAHHV